MSMKYYRGKGEYGFRPNYIVQYPDVNGNDRSVGIQFKDTLKEFIRLPKAKAKGFWRIKWKTS